MELEEEFAKAKINLLYDTTIKRMKQMYEDSDTVDLPEFCKPPEDILAYYTKVYLNKVLLENRLNDTLLNLI